MASAGHTSAQAPQAEQVSSSTFAGIIPTSFHILGKEQLYICQDNGRMSIEKLWHFATLSLDSTGASRVCEAPASEGYGVSLVKRE
jgi:hypothetical protein